MLSAPNVITPTVGDIMTKRLVLTFQTDTPPQWERFIKEYTGPPFQYDASFPYEQITISDTRFRLMCAIQREVGELIRYRRDEKGNDHWQIQLSEWGVYGDCEDFALTKRALLLEAGFPRGAVWPVLCKRDGVGHMVTVVSSTNKDYVMDIDPYNWVHDAESSKVEWLSAYDGEKWRLCSLA